MAESKKQPAKRPDGGVCIHRSVGLPKPRVFYGKTKAVKGIPTLLVR